MGSRPRDPVDAQSDRETDLYEISDWEPRSRLDRIAQWLYYGLQRAFRLGVVVLAVGILLVQVAFGSLGALGSQPLFGALAVLSAIPALVLAAYIWYTDVTTSEPLPLLVGTFLLGVLFAGFAGVLNDVLGTPIRFIGSGFGLFAPSGLLVFFYIVVGPVEEGVKLLAVRLYAFRDDRFDAVIDGAVYGAAAGLGFATIENALYIVQNTETVTGTLQAFSAGGDIAAVRALAGPGHVIYSAFAGYYLGLAKFNRNHAGPIVLKGLIIASLIHATYNTLAGPVTGVVSVLYGIDPFIAFLGFVVVYDGIFILLLLGKLNAYRQAYDEAHADDGVQGDPKIPDIDN